MVLFVICVYTMASALPIFPAFEYEDLSSAGPRWKKWLGRFEVLLSAMDIKNMEGEKRRKKCVIATLHGR